MGLDGYFLTAFQCGKLRCSVKRLAVRAA